VEFIKFIAKVIVIESYWLYGNGIKR